MATAINVTSNGTGVALGGSTAENNKVKAYTNFYVETPGSGASALYLHRTPVNTASWRLINDESGILKFQCDYLNSDGKKGNWYDLLSVRHDNRSIRTSGEIISSNPNAFRAVNGNYGFLIRNDGSDVYFLIKNGDPDEGWSTDNPFPLSIKLSSGVCSINGSPGNVRCGTGSNPFGNKGNIYIQY